MKQSVCQDRSANDLDKAKKLTVSVVVVTWNRKSDLLNAINSLNEQSLKPDQIIVVDNGSSDGTVETVRNQFSEIILIENKSNLGACYGRNAGTDKATSDLIYYIDDDITLDENCIQEFVRVFEQYPRIAAVQTTIFDPWTDPNLPCEPILKYCPHPREGSFAIRRHLLLPKAWPEHFSRAGEGPWIALYLYNLGYESVFWGAGKTFHHLAPGGNRERVRFFFARNSFLTYYQRMPLLLVLPITIYKILRTLVAVRTWKDLKTWLTAIGDGLLKIFTGKAPRNPISIKAAKKYFHAVRYQHQPIPDAVVRSLAEQPFAVNDISDS